MNEFVLRLMKCARAYEAFIGTKLRSKQNINAEELASIRIEAVSHFPELKSYQRDRGVESAELELFNKVLHNTMLKAGFRVPTANQTRDASGIYIRR
ncbi:conserved hypothetical protein [Vibrio jasicida]|uniref:hypothetical protein n=1 Tax=Vibrio jasicida TaxID=766224 RepID=UPI0006CFB51A|nr:conserved hypothetical protein [Vibrio jasicida]